MNLKPKPRHSFLQRMRTVLSPVKLGQMFRRDSQVSSMLGLDQGSNYIKLVHLGFPIEIKACVRLPVNDEIKIKEWLSGNKVSGTAALSLADERVDRLEVSLPPMPDKEVPSAIEWELKRKLGSLESVVYDTCNERSENNNRVVCFVAARDLVKAKFDQTVSLGLQPFSLETESSALATLLRKLHPEAPRVAIIDLGYSAIRFIFIHDDKISLVRSLYFGWTNLHQAAMNQLQIRQEDLPLLFEELENNPATESEDMFVSLRRELQELLYSVCEEFERSENFLREEKGLTNVSAVFLCGGGACLPSVVKYLRKHLSDKDTQLLDPFQLPHNIAPEVERKWGPLWACSVGLTLRN